MATRQEITEAIQQGIAKVESTFGALSDKQLQTKVHDGDGGWNAKEILAHLAGRARGYELMSQLAAGGSFPAGFDGNRWNQERVAERIDHSRDELLAEFRTVHEGLAATVQTLDDAALDQTIQFGPQPIPVGEMLRRSGGLHSVAHAEEVDRALGLG